MGLATDKRVWILGGVSVVAAVCALLVTHRPPEPAAGLAADSAALAAKHAVPLAAPAPVARSYPGVILARNAVDLAPKLDGTLEAIKVELGQSVSKGAVVAVVDVGPLIHDLRIEEARLREVRAAASRFRVARASSLRRDKRNREIAMHISKEEVEQGQDDGRMASANAVEANARVAESEAKVQQLRELVASGEIRAPFDGVVTERYLAPGARVSRSTPILRLIGQNAFGVRFAVPGDDAQKVHAGMPVRVEIEGSELSLDGQVENVSPEIDPSIQTLVAEARLTTGNAMAPHIPSGQSARIFVLGEPAQAQRR